jgi:predicted ATPase
LKATSSVALSPDALPVDGTGLAGLLADWKLEDDPRFLRVQQQLEKVVPQVRGLFPRRDRNSYQLFFLVGPEKKKIPAHAMSTGTLYTLALLVLLESLEQRSVLLLVDDLDRDLHPEAQGVLVGHLRGLLELNPELQIIATSHSPYLVDHFLGSEVLVMALDHEGYGCISPMMAHPDYHRLGKAMQPGEFWSAVGERWVSTKGGQTP